MVYPAVLFDFDYTLGDATDALSLIHIYFAVTGGLVLLLGWLLELVGPSPAAVSTFSRTASARAAPVSYTHLTKSRSVTGRGKTISR